MASCRQHLQACREYQFAGCSWAEKMHTGLAGLTRQQMSVTVYLPRCCTRQLIDLSPPVLTLFPWPSGYDSGLSGIVSVRTSGRAAAFPSAHIPLPLPMFCCCCCCFVVVFVCFSFATHTPHPLHLFSFPSW